MTQNRVLQQVDEDYQLPSKFEKSHAKEGIVPKFDLDGLKLKTEKSIEQLTSNDLHPKNQNLNGPNPYHKVSKSFNYATNKMNPYGNGTKTVKKRIPGQRQQSPITIDEPVFHSNDMPKPTTFNFKTIRQLQPIGLKQDERPKQFKKNEILKPFSKAYIAIAQEHEEKVRIIKE